MLLFIVPLILIIIVVLLEVAYICRYRCSSIHAIAVSLLVLALSIINSNNCSSISNIMHPFNQKQ